MGRIILNFQMSLDGIVSEPNKWAKIDDELMQSSIDRYDKLDAAIFGSKTFPGMADYWKKAEMEADSPLERELAAKLNRKKKYVVSRSDVEINWENSELLKFGDIQSLAAKLDALKNQTGKDITVESGLKLWQVFIRNLLFDIVCCHVHPVIAGIGDKLFDSDQQEMKLKLSDSKIFENGVAQLNYQYDK